MLTLNQSTLGHFCSVTALCRNSGHYKKTGVVYPGFHTCDFPLDNRTINVCFVLSVHLFTPGTLFYQPLDNQPSSEIAVCIVIALNMLDKCYAYF